MRGRGQMRARWIAVALVGLLLTMCGSAASDQTATAATGPAAAPAAAPGTGPGAGPVPGSAVATAPVPVGDPAVPVGDRSPAADPVTGSAPEADGASAPSFPDADPDSAPGPSVHTARGQADSADDPAVDEGPSRCHKSKGDGQGTLPSAPSSSGQQSIVPFVLAACLIPESHVALGAAHARPPVYGPAPAPPPTPVELSVLRV